VVLRLKITIPAEKNTHFSQQLKRDIKYAPGKTPHPLENTINNPPEPLCDPFLLFKAFCKISFMVTFILST